jgi:hypothetical protein
MSHCHALKKNNTRCRAFASIESCSDDLIVYKHTCKIHENYFDTFQLTKNLVESLEFWPGISEFLKEAFELDLVCVKEDFVESLANHSKYSYFYLLAAKFSHGFRPWNQPLYQKTFKLMWIWMGRIGPVQITYADLLALAKIDPMPGFYTMVFSRDSRNMSWMTIYELCASEEWFEVMYHADAATHEHLITQSKEHFRQLPFDAELKEWFRNTKEAYYTNIRRRIPFKEELTAIAWSPERLNWCLDEEVKKRIQKLKFAFP